jgi:UDP-2,3-diacylglucosamine pyrophosphatase LpxH
LIDRVTDRQAAGRSSRTLFLSDMHLGALGSRSDRLLWFLERHEAETYVLAGDVLDLWRPLLPHWTDADQAVVDLLNARAARGARMVIVPGNHDPDPTRAPLHARLNGEIVPRYIHQTARGRRYLVVHGDEVDTRLVRNHMMTRLGSLADHTLRRMDDVARLWRRRSQGEVRSAIEALLVWINARVYAGHDHERRLIAVAQAEGLDGVICGHFHIPGLHDLHGLTYANCGDWVDSCTAIHECTDGSLHLLTVGRHGEPAWAPAPSLAGA